LGTLVGVVAVPQELKIKIKSINNTTDFKRMTFPPGIIGIYYYINYILLLDESNYII
jgi:hypothetical protein